jgi:hypothetical protein
MYYSTDATTGHLRHSSTVQACPQSYAAARILPARGSRVSTRMCSLSSFLSINNVSPTQKSKSARQRLLRQVFARETQISAALTPAADTATRHCHDSMGLIPPTGCPLPWLHRPCGPCAAANTPTQHATRPERRRSDIQSQRPRLCRRGSASAPLHHTEARHNLQLCICPGMIANQCSESLCGQPARYGPQSHDPTRFREQGLTIHQLRSVLLTTGQ